MRVSSLVINLILNDFITIKLYGLVKFGLDYKSIKPLSIIECLDNKLSILRKYHVKRKRIKTTYRDLRKKK